MSPEEIVAEIQERNRQKFAEKILNLLNEATVDGFQFGSSTALSMVKGSLIVKAASMDKSKEGGK